MSNKPIIVRASSRSFDKKKKIVIKISKLIRVEMAKENCSPERALDIFENVIANFSIDMMHIFSKEYNKDLAYSIIDKMADSTKQKITVFFHESEKVCIN